MFLDIDLCFQQLDQFLLAIYLVDGALRIQKYKNIRDMGNINYTVGHS